MFDFLHHSRNRYVYFRNRASKAGKLHWTWWLLTLALRGRLCRALHPKLYATCNLCMHVFRKLHHNCDAHMGVQKERKSTLLTAFEHREKEVRSLFAAKFWYRSCLWMSLSSESSVSNKIPRYLYWSTDFTYWPPNFNNRVAVLFALLALNVMLTVLLQLKIIPCNSAYVWHTSSILCNYTWAKHRNIINKYEVYSSYNNNDILLRTHGPYHRHKNTKSG